MKLLKYEPDVGRRPVETVMSVLRKPRIRPSNIRLFAEGLFWYNSRNGDLPIPKGPKQRGWVYEHSRLERVPSCHGSIDRTREEELKWDD